MATKFDGSNTTAKWQVEPLGGFTAGDGELRGDIHRAQYT